MSTRPPPPAFQCKWRTKTVRNEMSCNSIAEGISYVFHAVEPEARTKLLARLAEIDTKLREKSA